MSNTKAPKHIAFIMDGNRRWARAHKLQLLMGHNKGAEQIETIVEAASRKGITHTTFWAFSTENWNRSKEEVAMLMQVFRNVLFGPIIERMIKKGVKLQVIGDYIAFPDDIVSQVEKLIELSKDNNKITATIALNYGGRAELVRAAQFVREEDTISEKTFASHLFTAGQPDPDMIVRTGGEQRLSGFLPWQSIYSELYFTDVYWPDFDESELDKALEEFSRRQRRFGK